MRLIDADALKIHVCNMCDDGQRECKGDDSCAILCWINDMTTIEPEVRHGRWEGWTTSKFTGKYKDYDEPEFKDYVYYTCSECYRKSAIQELYCPQCGARMDGGADNDKT